MKRASLSGTGLVISICLLGSAGGTATGAAEQRVKIRQRADLILHHGNIATMDEPQFILPGTLSRYTKEQRALFRMPG